MGSPEVVKAQIATDRGAGFRDAGVSPQVDLRVFDCPPKALDEDVVAPRPFAVHADLDFPARQHLDELGRGELAALIRVEDFRGAMFGQRLLDGIDAEVGLQCDRHPL